MAKSKAKIRTNARYGWVPDLPDHRDHLYAAPAPIIANLPAKVDLRPNCPPVVDQGQLGSCTANAIANAHLFDQMKQKLAGPFLPSRLFIYYNERTIEGTVNSDSGAQIRDGIKSIGQQGACPETLWPYDISKFTKKPAAKCFQEGLKNQAISYQSVVQAAMQMKGCLAEGYPIVIGFTVYESFESPAVARTGNAPMPASSEKVVGGHCVLVVGYDDATQRFLCMNSWATTWGLKGFFTIPYAYLTDSNLANDFWTIRIVK
jgi:C1A family cysteine protease